MFSHIPNPVWRSGSWTVEHKIAREKPGRLTKLWLHDSWKLWPVVYFVHSETTHDTVFWFLSISMTNLWYEYPLLLELFSYTSHFGSRGSDVSHATTLVQTKISQQVFDGLSWNFKQTFMVPRGRIILTSMMPWLFLSHHQRVNALRLSQHLKDRSEQIFMFSDETQWLWWTEVCFIYVVSNHKSSYLGALFI